MNSNNKILLTIG